MFAVNGILFNHESERRGENFVTRKITLAAGRIAEGLQDHLELGNMDSLRDWGYAKDYAKKNNADLLLATDPDCDRVGIAVKNTQGEYVLLSGNETGMLLLDYICSRRTQMKTMPQDPVTVKTIVTIDMAERIAARYRVSDVIDSDYDRTAEL